jgi:transposase
VGADRATDAEARTARSAGEVDFREVISAVRYLVRSGGGWRMLPIHFGPWQTVYAWFRELARRFLFQTIHDVALMIDRERAGREPALRGL